MPPLPPHRFYYLHNFQRALSWLAERYGDVLASHEQAFFAQFAAMPQAAQALAVRMLMRRGPWFRASQLRYDELPDLDAALAPLLHAGWLDAQAPMTADELFALYTKAELSLGLAYRPSPAPARKADWLAAVQAEGPAAQLHSNWFPTAQEPVWRLTIGELCERFRLMYFGNLHQTWSEFVLADLGVFRYETVPISAESRVFQTRADVDTCLQLHACRQALDEGRELAQLLPRVAACASANPWLEKRRNKLLLRLGQQFERQHDWAAAEGVYMQCDYPGARHRRIRVHEQQGRFDEALALALQAQQEPESEEESQRVARMLGRLRRKVGGAAARRRSAPSIPSMVLALAPATTPMSVEQRVREHLHRESAPVFWVENTLVNSLFGLLCWPAIFAPLPGAFFHPFQRGPADLNAPDFHARRAPLFDACLARLDTPHYRGDILQRYTDKFGVQSPFVSWEALSLPMLNMALDCIPAAHLKHFFTRLLSDVRANRSGFPDLVQFFPAEQRCAWIEVKGPGDRLQDNQTRWMQYCLIHAIPVSVCHVNWVEAGGDAP